MSHPPTLGPSEHYCTKTTEQVQQLLGLADLAHGLRSEQLAGIQASHGWNEYTSVSSPSPGASTRPWALRLVTKLWAMLADNPLILMLLASALVSALLGQVQDAVSISLAIVIVLTVAYVQEQRSEQSLEALTQLMPHYCNVLRDGQVTRINTVHLVPGDVVHLGVGDRIPADLRFVETGRATSLLGERGTGRMLVDESTLTGESSPVLKTHDVVVMASSSSQSPPPPSAPSASGPLLPAGPEAGHRHAPHVPLNERRNIGFMGTLVLAGAGSGIVIATGAHTELGRIFHLLSAITPNETPLQYKMKRLGEQLALLSVAFILGIGVVGALFQGRGILSMFTIGVSLAVAAIPEGLPIVVTVTLALGVIRMAKQQVIIKKLAAVESLGSVNVLCLDKTGTITMNQMTLQHMWTFASAWRRAGLQPLISGRYASAPALLGPALHHLLRIGNMCNAAVRNDRGQYLGQPTERCILELVHHLGLEDERFALHPGSSEPAWIRRAECPFDSETQWMAVEYAPSPARARATGVTGSTYFVKGSPETLVEICQLYMDADRQPKPMDQATRRYILDHAAQLARSHGLRVLAAASGPDLRHLVFAGLFGMQDLVRPGVAAMFRGLVGVDVVMITGDSRDTALAIARETGILVHGGSPHLGLDDSAGGSSGGVGYSQGQNRQCMSGAELDDLVRPAAGSAAPLATMASSSSSSSSMVQAECLPAAALEAVRRCRIFYRTSPRQKMTVVRALQQAGSIVAMSGDGVNDAPALRLADIGVALGSGTDVSKEAADVVLVRDELPTLLLAIEEGKALYSNIQSFLCFQLSTSISALLLIALCILLGLPSPMNAMQILWINILCDGPVAQSLGVEAVRQEVRRAGPVRKEDPILPAALLRKILLSSACMVVGSFVVMLLSMPDRTRMSGRETTLIFTTFIFFDLWNSLSCRSRSQSIFAIGFLSNVAYNYAAAFCLLGQLIVIYVPWFQSIFQTQALLLSDLLLLALFTSSVFWLDEWRKARAGRPGYRYDAILEDKV